MIIQPYNIALRLDQRQTEQVFQVGSELRATVRSSSSGQLHLELADGRILTPQSTVSLQHGAQLLLRVTQTQPIVVLQIIQAESDSEAVQTALRALLATSGSRTSLVTSLAALFSTSAAARLPSDVTTAVQQLQQAHTHPSERLINSSSLAEVLRHAGPFLESNLLHSATIAPHQDLKARLLRLATMLRATLATPSPSPDTLDRGLLSALLDQGERALARIEAQQLQALSGPDLDLLFELPLLADGTPDKLQIRIQDERPAKDDPAASDGDMGLLVRLRFDFAATGSISTLLRLRDDALELRWWAELDTTRALLQASLPQLETHLSALGFDVKAMDCSDGKPPAIDELPILQTRGLIHEKA